VFVAVGVGGATVAVAVAVAAVVAVAVAVAATVAVAVGATVSVASCCGVGLTSATPSVAVTVGICVPGRAARQDAKKITIANNAMNVRCLFICRLNSFASVSPCSKRKRTYQPTHQALAGAASVFRRRKKDPASTGNKKAAPRPLPGSGFQQE
jgi:hypothetical protein